MILFQENWEQEVREYLRPFLVTPTPSPEITTKFNLNIYKLEILQKKPRIPKVEDDGHWGEFLFGSTRFHHLTSQTHNSEIESRITWAKKSDCPSPICFLAAAILIENNFDLTICKHVINLLHSDREVIRIFSHESLRDWEDGPSLILAPDESWSQAWDTNTCSISLCNEPKLAEFVCYRWGSDGKPLPEVTQSKEFKTLANFE